MESTITRKGAVETCPHCGAPLESSTQRRRTFTCGTVRNNCCGWYDMQRSPECLRMALGSLSPSGLARRIHEIADHQSPADYYATMDEEDVAVLRVAADLLIASSPHDA
jgi:hypothetical protein